VIVARKKEEPASAVYRGKTERSHPLRVVRKQCPEAQAGLGGKREKEGGIPGDAVGKRERKKREEAFLSNSDRDWRHQGEEKTSSGKGEGRHGLP